MKRRPKVTRKIVTFNELAVFLLVEICCSVVSEVVVPTNPLPYAVMGVCLAIVVGAWSLEGSYHPSRNIEE